LLDPKTNHAMTVILVDLCPDARQQVKVIDEVSALTGSGGSPPPWPLPPT
jgi:hypothetical protein